MKAGFMYLLILFLSVLIKVNGELNIKIESANENVTITQGTSTYTASMDENNNSFEGRVLLFRVVDVSDTPTVSFLIPTTDTFEYEFVAVEETPNSYNFYALESFDYETGVNSRSFNLLAENLSGSGQTFVVVVLNIKNIDDESPSLTTPQCTFDENTIYNKVNSTCSCIVTDPDGFLDEMTFEIVSVNNELDLSYFDLEYQETPEHTGVYTANVYVTTKQALDYENRTFHIFDIRALDGAKHSTSPELTRAVVYVNDLPDEPPVWTSFFNFQQFSEQEEQTFNVIAVDGDYGLNWDIGYRLLWETYPEENYVSISNDGVISVAKIDRDKYDLSTYNFEIQAYEVNDSTSYINLNITFYVTDIDNKFPLVEWVIDANKNNVTMSEPKATELSVLENSSGNLNISIFIRDIDAGENAQFEVSIEDLEGALTSYAQAFLIVPTAGYRSGQFQVTVSNYEYLDYEDETWRNIEFDVVTKGTLNDTKTDKMQVSISLIDYNDEYPIFELEEYEISINETAPKDFNIIEVLATDTDAEDIVLNHVLIGSTYSKRVLTIDNETGVISVKEDDAFDYDTVNPIFVQVRATDKGNHSTTVPVTINLLDVNNKAPTITSNLVISVEENQSPGIELSTSITATDMDTTASLTAEINWEASYATKNSRRLNISQEMRFVDISYEKVDEFDDTNNDINIKLTVNDQTEFEAPDFETFDSLYLSVIVTDLETDPDFLNKRQTTALIVITITDVNDNVPYFPEADLSQEERTNRTVSELANIGTSAGSIYALDLDVDDTVSYSCMALNSEQDWIEVNSVSGAFTVKNNTIDADRPYVYYFYFNCTASDGTFTSEPVTVAFYILDTNNKSPVILLDSDSILEVDEKVAAGTEIQVIETDDEDRDIPFHTVECSLDRTSLTTCFDSFLIQNNVIMVRLGEEDINRDEGTSSYSCSMTCSDNVNGWQNEESRSETVSFTINLRDINDNKPEVLTKSLETYENILKSEVIGKIIARDIDEGDNAAINFNITKVVKTDDNSEPSDLFDIVEGDDYLINATYKQNDLVALQNLENHYGTYIITIGVQDRGNPMQSDLTSVTLIVNKYNFEEPRIIYPTENLNIILLSTQTVYSQLILYKNSELLPNFYASDNSISETCTKWDVQFSLQQTIPITSTIFEVVSLEESCTAQLQVNSLYSTEAILGKTFTLKLTASVSDRTPIDGEASYTSERTITVNFLDNNQKPVFSVTSWSFNMLEEDETEFKDLQYEASYEVEDNEGLSIFYYLVSSDEDVLNHFLIDNFTGRVSLAEKLDYETIRNYTFQIVASNDSNSVSDNPNSYLQVTVDVIDINDNTPEWTRENFFGTLMAGYIRNTPLLTVEATDADSIDQGLLTYNLSSPISSFGSGLTNIAEEPFLITNTTGEIKLNFQVETSMTGYFQFNVSVSDVQDSYGNGPHTATTFVIVHIITSSNTVDFTFSNTLEEVQNVEVAMLETISDILEYTAYRQNIDKYTDESGAEYDDRTYASLYFINESTVEAAESKRILTLVSNYQTYSKLSSQLLNNTGLILMSFPSTGTATENTEALLRAWLIGVSVVLGLLVIIIAVVFVVKIKELNNRITKLTTKKFGSQESGLNRLGVADLPTTNKRAIEGSNPVYNNETVRKTKIHKDFDQGSIRSGDSDLIGIEDNPEFDDFYNKIIEKNDYNA